jgi:hypothetical protein
MTFDDSLLYLLNNESNADQPNNAAFFASLSHWPAVHSGTTSCGRKAEKWIAALWPL